MFFQERDSPLPTDDTQLVYRVLMLEAQKRIIMLMVILVNDRRFIISSLCAQIMGLSL